MAKEQLMFNRMVSIILLSSFISFSSLAEVDIDQWQDSEKTYRNLIDEGFEVKAYDMNTIPTDSGHLLMFFVTVLQKNKEVYECQEYQTLDNSMKTIDMSLICRRLVQPYKKGIGT